MTHASQSHVLSSNMVLDSWAALGHTVHKGRQIQGLVISPLYLQEDTWYMMYVNLSQHDPSPTKVKESVLYPTGFQCTFLISANMILIQHWSYLLDHRSIFSCNTSTKITRDIIKRFVFQGMCLGEYWCTLIPLEQLRHRFALLSLPGLQVPTSHTQVLSKPRRGGCLVEN